MTRPFEHRVRQVTKHFVVPALMFATVSGSTGPTQRATGYGGVLTVPVSAQAGTRDSMPSQRKDRRAVRGRVLYPDGRTASTSGTGSLPSPRGESRTPAPTCRVAAPSRSRALPTS